MSLIVQKFGGSSVANAERVFNVAKIITDTYKKGNQVVVVVSAQSDTTDDLIDKANEINPKASKREMDMLLSAGEQISVALLAMAIEKMGFPVVSLLGWQAGFETTSADSSARITRVRADRIRKELDKNNIEDLQSLHNLSLLWSKEQQNYIPYLFSDFIKDDDFKPDVNTDHCFVLTLQDKNFENIDPQKVLGITLFSEEDIDYLILGLKENIS